MEQALYHPEHGYYSSGRCAIGRKGDYFTNVSVGRTERMHFQIWSDKASNAPPLTAFDPVTGLSVTFPDLSDGGNSFRKT